MSSSKSYAGEYLGLFRDFLLLADDSEACIEMVARLLPWEDVKRILSIGGGGGSFELSLLKKAPHAQLWYLDPSPEQCMIFSKNSVKQGVSDRVKDVAQSTFQNYRTKLAFDRVVSSFSCFYIGTEAKWLEKMLSLMTTDGAGIILIQHDESIEAVLNKMLCPDPRMSLTGLKLCQALRQIPCSVELHKHTKWLPERDLFGGAGLTTAAKSFAAFIAQKPVEEISESEWKRICNAFDSKREARGIPLITDILIVRKV